MINPAPLFASVAALVGLAASIHHRTPRLVWNASASVPIGLYVIVPTPPRRGELALVRLPPRTADLARRRRYLMATPYVLKRVAAVGGDRVCRIGRRIFVQGHHGTTALWRDRARRIMPVWQGCRRLSGGDVFLLTDDTLSFDSRYFGPISAQHVGGRTVPLIQQR